MSLVVTVRVILGRAEADGIDMKFITAWKGARRKTAMSLLGVVGGIALVVGMTPAAAQAANLNLPSSAVYLSKTYYTTPHYHTASGAVSVHVTTNTETCGAGGRVNVGMRTNASTGTGESTQFPSVLTGTTVAFRNVGAPPAQNTIFAAGTYYVNAQIGCTAGAHWSGYFTGSW